jgi:hypothetical protein
MKGYHFKKWHLFFMCFVIVGNIISCGSIGNTKPRTEELTVDTVLIFKIVKSKEKQCTDWQEPRRSDVLSLLYSLNEVTGREWNDCYGDWTCGIEGELIYKGKRSYFRLDAGGWIILNDGEKQQYFVCKEDSCWKYFPSESLCDDDK